MADVVTDRVVVELLARLDQYDRKIDQSSRLTEEMYRKIMSGGQRMEHSLRSSFMGSASSAEILRRALYTLGAYLGTREIIAYADSWHQVNRALSATEQIFGVHLGNADKMVQIATKTRSDLDATTKLYTRTAAATRDLGISEAEVAKVTETVAKSLKLGSASASEQASVLLQLSQAFQKGKLDGDEFRTVMENAGIIQKALADKFDVTRGEIIKMAQEGKLKVADLIAAILQIAPAVDKAFDKSRETIGEAFTNLETKFTAFIGKLSDEGAFDAAVSGIELVGDHLEDLAKAATVAAAALGTAGLYGAAMKAVAGLGALSAAIAANPVGAAVVVIAAATTAMVVYADKLDPVIRLTREDAVAQRELNALLYNADGTTRSLTDAERGRATELAKQRLELNKNILAEQELRLERLKSAAAGAPQNSYLAGKTGYRSLAAQQLAQDGERLKAAIEKSKENIKTAKAELDQAIAAPIGGEGGPAQAAVTTPDEKAIRLAERRAQAMSAIDADLERSNTRLVAATNDAYVQMTRGTDEYYGAVRRQIDSDADAQIKAIRARENEQLTALARMAKGWKEYEEARAKISADAQAQIDALDQKRTATLADPLADIRSKTRELTDQAKVLGLTAAAADRLRTAEQANFVAAALDAGGHADLAQKVRDAALAYDLASRALERNSQDTQRAIQLSDQFRSGLEATLLASTHGFDSLADAAANFLATLGQMMLQLYVLRPIIESIFGKAGTPISLSGIGDFFAGMFAGGGTIPVGQWGIVNDGGKPEPVRATPQGIQVMPGSNVNAIPDMPSIPAVPQISAGGSRVVVNYSDNRIIHAENADAAGLDRLRADMARDRQDQPGRMKRVIADMHRNREGPWNAGV